MSQKLVPVFTSGELSALERVCQGRTFAQRRDCAIIAVFKATGLRLSELAGIRHDPDDPLRSDVDLWRREILVGGKGGQARIVRIGHEAARSLDRYIRLRARHEQAYRPQLWLGVNNRAPMTANGIYQMIACAAASAGSRSIRIGSGTISATPGWIGVRGERPDGAERLDLPADAAPLRPERAQRASPPQLRPHHGRLPMTGGRVM